MSFIIRQHIKSNDNNSDDECNDGDITLFTISAKSKIEQYIFQWQKRVLWTY